MSICCLLLPSEACSKQPSHMAPHTPAPVELHAHNSHFILGKLCKQLWIIFKAVRNSRKKKNPQQTQDIQDKHFHAPLETKQKTSSKYRELMGL